MFNISYKTDAVEPQRSEHIGMKIIQKDSLI